MNKPKFTKGGWVAIYPEQRHIYKGSDLSAYEVMSVKTRGELTNEGATHYNPDPHNVNNLSIASAYWRDMADEEAKANAHLIATAPDMYELLSDLFRNCELGDNIDAEIEDVLAKARGEV